MDPLLFNQYLGNNRTIETMRVESENLPAIIESSNLQSAILYYIPLGQNQFDLAIWPCNQSVIGQNLQDYTHFRLINEDPLFLGYPGESRLHTVGRVVETILTIYENTKAHVEEAPAQTKQYKFVMQWLKEEIEGITMLLSAIRSEAST
ncbi:uncharacterized protein N7483_012385 [Penicillium malachiteum]|uniref:uncharacterized protein n=1 Tax=Penicillium malachiteum TaxID=1324776 RepID=UPI002546656C|nr:uncharacterized protein N7483_012385 [Penicillium malachiteum]KAJ5715204.1 hypothetical protein N7483_012385 [Penicillium malachiteum]